MILTVKERILMIRLAQKLEKRPPLAEALGLEIAGAVRNQKQEADRKGP